MVFQQKELGHLEILISVWISSFHNNIRWLYHTTGFLLRFTVENCQADQMFPTTAEARAS